MKHVTVFYDGSELKQFDCKRADISGHVINFYGVPRKRGNGGDLSLFYCGELYTDVNHAERIARVTPINEPSIEIVVTW